MAFKFSAVRYYLKPGLRLFRHVFSDRNAAMHSPYLCASLYIGIFMLSLSPRRLLLLFPLLLLLASCSEDFNVGAPYKPITVVYGLMDVADTAHYIRIQKAFFDENKSAFNMAQTADSNFFSSLVVHLKSIYNGVTVWDEVLPRVDLIKEGYGKDSGAFFYRDSSFAYKTKRKLGADTTYRLVIINTATDETDSAETPIILNSFLIATSNVGFGQQSGKQTPWTPVFYKPANAATYEGLLRFRWVDVDAVTNAELRDDSVTYHFFATKEDERSVTLSLDPAAFYAFLQSNIPAADPLRIYRKISKADLIIWVGTQDFKNYIAINGAQGGLTADEIKPIYTNVKGANVYGLFTARTSLTKRLPYAPEPGNVLDSLLNKASLKSLNFKGTSNR